MLDVKLDLFFNLCVVEKSRLLFMAEISPLHINYFYYRYFRLALTLHCLLSYFSFGRNDECWAMENFKNCLYDKQK